MLPVADIPEDRSTALFLDLDGTLVDIQPRPEQARADRQLLNILERLHRELDQALAVVSGRSIAGIDEVLAPLRLPAAGVHGLEIRRADGQAEATGEARLPSDSWQRLKEFADRHSGLLAENKGLSAALHFRGAPDLQAEAEDVVAGELARLGEDFVLQRGKMVLELRPAGATKGTAVDRFMQAPPYAGRLPVYIGDDVTDEDGFRAVNDAGGLSIRVGSDDAKTQARWRLDNVAHVRSWLEELLRRQSRHCA